MYDETVQLLMFTLEIFEVIFYSRGRYILDHEHTQILKYSLLVHYMRQASFDLKVVLRHI